MAKIQFRSISTRFIALTVTMVVVLFGGLGLFIAKQNDAALRTSLNSKAGSVADLASRVGTEHLTNFNFMALDALVDDIAKDPEVGFVGYYNPKQELVTKRQAPADEGHLQVLERTLKDADGGVIGTLKLGYRRDTITRALFRSILTVGSGTVVAIILFAFGIARASTRMILKPIKALCEVTSRVSSGDLSQRLEVTSDDELGVLAKSLNEMIGNLHRMVQQITQAAQELNVITEKVTGASGKVVDSAKLQAESISSTSSAVVEINATIKGVSESVDSLSTSAAESSSSILEMAASVEEVALTVDTLAHSVSEVSSSVTQMDVSIKQIGAGVSTLLSASSRTALSINDMDFSIRQVESSAADASAISESVRKDAETGRAAVEESIAGIHEIMKSSEITFEVINSLSQRATDIGTILEVIDDVAMQTNLLALNAAIIAAQAGEQGRGFAVVADEIKQLAGRTRSSTQEITEVIRGVQDETRKAVNAIRAAETSINNGKELSERSGAALKKIYEGVEDASAQINAIARATCEQTAGSHLIRVAMEQISEMVSQINDAAREQALGSEQIMVSAGRMKELTSQVRSATHEQSKVAKCIAGSTENITGMISHISRACVQQTKGSEMISRSVDDIHFGSTSNLEATRTLDESVSNLFQQIEILRKEMRSFTV